MRRTRREPRKGAEDAISMSAFDDDIDRTYYGDNLLLEKSGERNKFEKQSEVELLTRVSKRPPSRRKDVSYRGDKEGERNGLLSTSHCDGIPTRRKKECRGRRKKRRGRPIVLRWGLFLLTISRS